MSDNDVRKAMSTLIRHRFHGLPRDLLGLFVNKALESTNDEPVAVYVVVIGNDFEVFWNLQRATDHIKNYILTVMNDSGMEEVSEEIRGYFEENNLQAGIDIFEELQETSIQLIERLIQ